ncbi:tyrosine-type recombinase/integrase [Streptomyces sp. NPDC048516]|uniref:tyrosine-type recombinase/integrase n=1 Tax=Streptomyces sp. NPDC048516 TaxID=3365565 RepID=UPI003712D88E
MHALRHFYASVLLDAGESIKALAEYLGHSDPGLTLKVYAHLMPSSRDRARQALSATFAPKVPRAEVPEGFQRMKMPPTCTICAGGRHDHVLYFFLPWFLTASMAALAASGSR